jgi:hypothetical protein
MRIAFGAIISWALDVRLIPPSRALEPEVASAEVPRKTPFIRHPWTIHAGDDSRDGVLVEISEQTAIGAASLFVGLYTFSYTSPEAQSEKWMLDSNLPPEHNALRMSTLFSHQFGEHGKVMPDELGDACIGERFQIEFCARVSTCVAITAPGTWRIAMPAKYASNYRVETYLFAPTPECVPYPVGAEPWWAPVIAEHTAPLRSSLASHAAYTRFRMLYVDEPNYWWADHAKVSPVTSWMEMMTSAVNTAGESLSAPADRSLWLEFGVGSGKTTAVIGWKMKQLFGEHGAMLHGFDSFQGLPESWEFTNLGPETFSMGGEIPEHLLNMSNVEIHVGLFNETLVDLAPYQTWPVAFAHVDVDLYSSAVTVLSSIACQLVAGTIVVFDELVNYRDFERSGEYRAWQYISNLYGIEWEYGGIIWQQALPIVIVAPGSACQAR